MEALTACGVRLIRQLARNILEEAHLGESNAFKEVSLGKKQL